MIRNVKLKKILVDGVFPVFSAINKLIKKDEKTIFIYCANDKLIDNSEALFHHLIDNKYNKKYRIICGVGNPAEYAALVTDNVLFITKSKCVFQYMRSGHVFYSQGKIPIKPTTNQCVINMWHGIPLKRIGKLANIDNGNEFFFTYVCASAEMFRPIMAQAFGCPEENVCICGEQKQDRLFERKENRNYKYIVWTPTFRQSAYLGYEDSTVSTLLPPLTDDEWEELNVVLLRNNVKMLVKLHPMQNLSGFDYEIKSHLQVMSDRYFREQGRNLYSELAQSDALISDFSSVYLEYLVINRPICFAMSDMSEYSETRGFVFDNPKDYMPGHFAETKEQLFSFIKDIANGRDPYREKRESVRERVHQYKDDKNCERVLEISGVKK